MSLKTRLFQFFSRIALAILRTADLFTGSNTGRDPIEVRQDPYTGFRTMRERGQVVRTYASRGWFVVGFEAVQTVFKDPRFGADMRKNKFLVRVLRAGADGKQVPTLDNPSLLTLDAPDHTRLRKLVSRGFLNKYIQSLEPQISTIVSRCLSGIDVGAERFDVMAQLAKPLPAIVIAEMLGLPEEDRAQFQAWSDDLVGLSNIGEPAMIEKAAAANQELLTYLAGVIESKRGSPDEDFIAQLIAAEEEGDRLSAEEMYSTCVLLLSAGHETTTRLIGNGLYLLLQHPDQLALLQRDRSLMDNAIEEMLRFEPPVQFMPRFATEDMEFFGKKLKKDQLVIALIASANRDEAANADPDVFDITRESIQHIAFGHGIHLCLGLALARLEARVALNAVLDRFPNMRLAEQEIVWTTNPFVRGVEQLIVECGDLVTRPGKPGDA